MRGFVQCALLLGLAHSLGVVDGPAADQVQEAAASGQSQTATPLAPVKSTPPPVVKTAPTTLPAETYNPLGEATTLARKGDFDAAIEKYQQLLKERPNSPDAYAGLTRVYLKKKDVVQAFDTVTKGMQVSDAVPLHVALGEVYFRQGKIPEAEQEWVKAINSGHAPARAYLGMARVRSASSMNKSAKAMIDKAHELDPKDPDIQSFWIETLGRPERIKYLESYLAEPNDLNADHRDDLGNYLSYLKERAKQPGHRCRLVSKVTATQTPLVRLLHDPTDLKGYGLSVALNGSKTNLLLDTGANGILVNRRVAERAGVGKMTETKIWGIGDKGGKTAFIGIADSIRIGELEFQNCPVSVIESQSVADGDGLIGADVFENFLVEINFPGEQLKLSKLPKRPGQANEQLVLMNEEDETDDPEEATTETDANQKGQTKNPSSATAVSGPQDRYIAPEMQSFSRVYRFGHDLLVPTRVGDAPLKLFLLDTGAWTNFISPAAAREVTKVHGDPDMLVEGMSGSVKKVYSANKAVLQFGHVRQENQDMVSFDMTSASDSAGAEVSGFLGFATLRLLVLKIDYRDGLVDFDYDPKRFDRFYPRH